MNKRRFLYLILLIGIFGIVYGAWLYFKPADTETTGVADFSMAPGDIIADFEKDKTAANAKYIGKSVRFGGIVASIEGDSNILIKLQSGIEGYTVNCGFNKKLKDKLNGIVVGDSIQVQCSCSGFSTPDAELSLLSEKSLDMTRCSLLNWKKTVPNLGTDVETVSKDSAPK